MRKRKVKKFELLEDPRFGDKLVTKFVNDLMVDGKKSIAYKVFYAAIDIIEEKMKKNGHEVWKKALENIMPGVEVRSKRIGGATFQIPTEIRPDRKISVGIKWMVKYARERKGKSMAERLSEEIMAASKGEGAAIKKKEDVHRMAEANKAFSHFRV